jgi:pilus assembly protein CpaF
MSLLEERIRRNRDGLTPVPDKPSARVEISVDPDDLRRIVREKLLSTGDVSSIYSGEGREDLKRKIFDLVGEQHPDLARMERAQVAEDIVMDITGYGPIQSLVQDADVSDILINRFDRIFYEKHGILQRSPLRFRSEKHLRDLIEKIVANVGRRLDESQPLVDARLPDGSRINAVVRPVSVDGAALCIRRFRYDITDEDLIKQGVLTGEQRDLLNRFVKARLNIIVSGGTGTGKTTYLNILSRMIPPHERVITIEDVTELNLETPNVVRLETRGDNIEGRGSIDAQMLVANALRMRPDRIVVGECRRGEAFDMLQAMNTGHDGSLTTLHANSPHDALFRLENMVLMAGYNLPLKVIRDYISSSVHIVVHLTRLASGARIIANISEVQRDDGNLFTVDLYLREGGVLVKKNEPSARLTRLLEVER